MFLDLVSSNAISFLCLSIVDYFSRISWPQIWGWWWWWPLQGHKGSRNDWDWKSFPMDPACFFFHCLLFSKRSRDWARRWTQGVTQKFYNKWQTLFSHCTIFIGGYESIWRLNLGSLDLLDDHWNDYFYNFHNCYRNFHKSWI